MPAQYIADAATSALSHPVAVQVINQGPGIWGNVITGLITGLLTGGIALTGIWLTHRFTLKREKKVLEDRLQRERYFIAIKLVFILEEFAEGCARVANDNGENNDANQPEREPTVNYPALNFKDIPGDWRSLPAQLMYRIHELPVLQDEAGRAISFASEHSWAPYHTEYFRERQYHYARLGLKAIIQARRLRKIAGFPDTRLDASPWSAQPILWEAWRIERRRRAAEAFENRDFCDTELEDMTP